MNSNQLLNEKTNWYLYIAELPPFISISEIEPALNLSDGSKVSITVKMEEKKLDIFLKLRCNREEAQRLLRNKLTIQGVKLEIRLAAKPKWIKQMKMQEFSNYHRRKEKPSLIQRSNEFQKSTRDNTSQLRNQAIKNQLT